MLGGSVLILSPCLRADNNNNNNNNGGTGGNNNNNNNNGGTGNNNSELLTLVNPTDIPLPSLESPQTTSFHLP